MGKENQDEKREIITSSLLASRLLESDGEATICRSKLENIYNFNEKQMEHYTGISSKNLQN